MKRWASRPGGTIRKRGRQGLFVALLLACAGCQRVTTVRSLPYQGVEAKSGSVHVEFGPLLKGAEAQNASIKIDVAESLRQNIDVALAPTFKVRDYAWAGSRRAGHQYVLRVEMVDASLEGEVRVGGSVEAHLKLLCRIYGARGLLREFVVEGYGLAAPRLGEGAGAFLHDYLTKSNRGVALYHQTHSHAWALATNQSLSQLTENLRTFGKRRAPSDDASRLVPEGSLSLAPVEDPNFTASSAFARKVGQ